LAADVLQTLVNHPMTQLYIENPPPFQCSHDFSIVQYANDTLLIMQANVQQILHLKELLQSFGATFEMKVNICSLSKYLG
jgi:hypothetical protein